jgi:lipopolysaccharide export system protein LptA
MSPFTFKLLRNFLLLLAGAVGIVASAAWLQHLAKIDPFANRRNVDTQPLGSEIAIRLQDVQMRQFKGAKLQVKAHIDKIEIQNNRQRLAFFGVHDAIYYAKDTNFLYDSERVDWDAVSQKVAINGKAQVQNKKVNLTSANFTYDQKKEVLDVPGTIAGKFFDGKLTSHGLVYNMKAEEYRTGPGTWEGMLASPFQEGGAKTRWKMSWEGGSQTKGNIQVALDARATDEEIIVKADRIERDIKTDVLTATGNVRYFSPRSNLRADKVIVDRKAKKATFVNTVRMLIKPEDRQTLDEIEIPPFQPLVPDEVAKTRPPAPVTPEKDDELTSTKTIKKYPIAITAARVEYWYGKGSRRAIITGAPQARQELVDGRWRTVFAHAAHYDGEKELLKLTSSGPGKMDAQMKNSRGDDFLSEWFEISTKDDDEEWSSGRGKGIYHTEEDEDDQANRNRFVRPKKNPPPLQGPIGRTRRM